MPTEALAKVEQRDLAKEMLEAGEINHDIAKRVEILLGMGIKEALAKLADKPEVLAAYRTAHEAMADELELLEIERKKIRNPDNLLKHTVTAGIIRLLRQNDCAEIIARGLAPAEDSLAVYENARIATITTGYTKGQFNDKQTLTIEIGTDQANDSAVIKELLYGAELSDLIEERKEYYSQKDYFLLPKIFLRNDFWTAIAHIASPNYLPEVTAPHKLHSRRRTYDQIINEAKHLTSWFKLPLREDEGRFYSGKIDKRQKAMRQQEVETIWDIATTARTKILEPVQKREQAKRTILLRELHAANNHCQKAQAAVDEENKLLSRLWSMVSNPASKLREAYLEDMTKAVTTRDHALVKLLNQQQYLLEKTHGFGLALIEDNKHRDPAPTYYQPKKIEDKPSNDHTLKYWSHLAAESFSNIAKEDSARQELATIRKR